MGWLKLLFSALASVVAVYFVVLPSHYGSDLLPLLQRGSDCKSLQQKWSAVLVPFNAEQMLSMGWTTLLFSVLVLALVIYLGYRQWRTVSLDQPDVTAWWGESDPDRKVDTSVKAFQVNFDKAVIDDLKTRLSQTRFFQSLKDAKFFYGFNQEYLKDVISYWKDNYDWFKWQSKLNEFPQYLTNIQGLDVHFVHLKAQNSSSGRPRAAAVLIHGWPSSFFEFHKAAPMLQGLAAKDDSGLMLDVVVPSLPGYGFSSAPARPGFNHNACAHVIGVLMERLGYEKYFVVGCDWGAVIGHEIALQRPNQVLGFHTTMSSRPAYSTHLAVLPLVILQSVAPSLIMSKEEMRFTQRSKGAMSSFVDYFEEKGYFLLQSTKPDTVGAALVDSPAGLAAYILEKFSTWTNSTNRGKNDGGLVSAFSIDELLTNVMVYWLSGNIASSMRMYKEFYKAPYLNVNVALTVPTGIANFPMDLTFYPRIIVGLIRPNIVHYTLHEIGGHFAAFEVPATYCADVMQFIKIVLRASRAS